MKKLSVITALFILVSLLLAACAVGGEPSDAPQSSEQAAASSEAASAEPSAAESRENVSEEKEESSMNIYNVRDYGAAVNGADASSAIQSAIDACAAAGGGTVYIPTGRYNLSKTVIKKATVSIRGDGMWATYLIWNGAAGGVMIDTANEALWGTSIEDMFLTSSAKNVTGIRGGSTLKNYNSAIGTFRNLVMSGLGTGIDGGAEPEGVGIFDCEFENIFCSDCGYGFHLYGSGNTIIHPRVATCDAGLVLDWLNGESFDGVHVIGGIFAANTVDILVPNKNGTRPCNFVGTWFETAKNGMIRIENAGTRVMNMTFRDCMLNSSADGKTSYLFDVSNINGVVTLDSCTVVDDKGIVGPTNPSGRLVVKNLQVYNANGSTAVLSDTENGVFAARGNGSTATYRIAHKLGVKPTGISVTAGNAASAGSFFVTADAEAVTVTYLTAPGKDEDIKLYWTFSK